MNLYKNKNLEMENQLKVKTFNYKEQHAVIIKVSSEKEQKALFEKLKKEGYKDLKIVSV